MTLLVAQDRIEVSGRDAESYLQGQLSQDIAGLAPGATSRSLLLEPTGKLGFWLTVERVAVPNVRDLDGSATGDLATSDGSPAPAGETAEQTAGARFVLGVDAGYGEAVLARLQRFKLRTKADFTLTPAPPADVAEADRHEAERIAGGIPRMGSELVADETIPAEAGQWFIDQSVSFTKGCYTGQELVARIDSRGGNVPRHLRAIALDGVEPATLPPTGAELVTADGKVVGRLTSVAWSDTAGAPVALGYVGRAIEPPAAVTVRWATPEAGEVTATVLPASPPAPPSPPPG